MRISLVNTNLVAEDAIGTCIMNQVRLFRRRGDDVRIYTGHAPERMPADIEAVTQVASPSDLDDGRFDHFRLSDLFVYHYPGWYDLIESIRKRDRGTVIFYYHNVTPPELWGTDVGRAELDRGVDATALVHYADLCITPSPYNKNILVDRFGYAADRIRVLPLAVPLERFSPGEKSSVLFERYELHGQHVLLYVGRMAGNKRIDLLIRGLAEVKRCVPNTKLLLVGDDRTNPAFRSIVTEARNLADELGVADDVTWTGRVATLPPYLRLADVYVTASLHEGFGLPLIEAMASGTPVVASRAGAMPWVLGEAGRLFEPGDADDLASNVLALLEDDSLYSRLVAAGLERSREFSLETYEDRLAEIVDRAVTYTLPEVPLEVDAAEPAPSQAEEDLKAPESPEGGRKGTTDPLTRIAQDLEAQSDISMRGYVVRSKLPVIGSLVAWIRRNLTSHLREPYLDPMIERQIAFNHQLVTAVRRAADALHESHQREESLKRRVEVLEGRLDTLTRLLSEPESEE